MAKHGGNRRKPDKADGAIDAPGESADGKGEAASIDERIAVVEARLTALEAGDRRMCLSKSGLAKLLGIGTRTVERMVARRQIPHHRFGGALRFSPGDVDAFLKQTAALKNEERGRA